MSVLSRENSSRLLWLGRYSERVYTTLRYFADIFDAMIDKTIPGVFESKEEFSARFCFDEGDESSVYSSLIRAYDNAIELREELGSDTFSYIQLAVYEMNKAKNSPAPLLQLQRVIDNIAAFWGMADDRIEDEHARSIIKLGKRIERVDLYARMRAGRDELVREIRRLTHRIPQTGLTYDEEAVRRLNVLASEEIMNYPAIISEAASLLR